MVWRLKPPHKVKVKGGGVDGFDVDVDFCVAALAATRYEAVGFV
jgi:hypothetical protein